jgi:competence protein ComFC
MNLRFVSDWGGWTEAALHFFYPGVCRICEGERVRAVEGFICQTCRWKRGNVRHVHDPFCDRCGLPFEGQITGQFVCSNCADLKLHFKKARAAVIATPFILQVVHQYKYGGGIWFEPFLAKLLIDAARPHLRAEKPDVIVPVPLHPVKLREREFNQAARLARLLAKACEIPLNETALRRVQFTQTQTLLSKQRRGENVRRAFAANPAFPLRGARVILVDDVLTTGSTTSSCASALLKAGVREVSVWTVARGL